MPQGGKKTKVVDKYTEKELGFCQMIAAGSTQWEAYRANYNTGGRSERDCRGPIGVIARKPKIKAKIKEIVMEKFMPFILEKQERMRILSDIAVFGNRMEQIKAIDQLNKIAGDYTHKLEVTEYAQVLVYLPKKRSDDEIEQKA